MSNLLIAYALGVAYGIIGAISAGQLLAAADDVPVMKQNWPIRLPVMRRDVHCVNIHKYLRDPADPPVCAEFWIEKN